MRRSLWLILTVLLLLVTACGSGGAPAAAAEQGEAVAENASADTVEEADAEMAMESLPEVNPLEVTGDIIIAGSSTVFPLAEAMAERFRDEGYSGNITIDSIGSGAGFERFCVAGESDISNASRPIRDSEIESCAAIERVPIEFRVGTDALAITVNPENDFLDNVTIEQLALIYSSETTNWSDVDESWPEKPILRFSPGTDSGTFDYLIEAVMDEHYSEERQGEEMLLSAGNLQLSEDDNVLVQGVEGEQYAIGYFGYAFYEENADRLKILSIEGVEASADSVDDGSYPLARPLFMYSDATIIKGKSQVGAFLNFVLTFVNEEVERVGYFPASDAALEGARSALLDALQ